MARRRRETGCERACFGVEALRFARSSARVFALALAFAASTGCAQIVDIPDVTLGSTACIGKAGPAMVQINADAAAYCIDTTEVTVAQFDDYLVQSGKHLGTPAVCDTAAKPPNVDGTPGIQGHPIGNIGVCDAWSYCQWAGKRLCGAIGGGPVTGATAPLDTEWVYACSNGKANTPFPYGQTRDAAKCNTDGGQPAPVGSRPDCHGTAPPFDQIYDMVGNAAELVNDIAQTSDSIAARGGSWKDGANAACGETTGFNGFISTFDTSGFRCCKDP